MTAKFPQFDTARAAEGDEAANAWPPTTLVNTDAHILHSGNELTRKRTYLRPALDPGFVEKPLEGYGGFTLDAIGSAQSEAAIVDFGDE